MGISRHLTWQLESVNVGRAGSVCGELDDAGSSWTVSGAREGRCSTDWAFGICAGVLERDGLFSTGFQAGGFAEIKGK